MNRSASILHTVVRHLTLLTCAACTSALPACSDRLLRETVYANTETLVGLSIEQDARTQMYQGRLGYARHELLLVPTSKRVAYTDKGESSGVDDNNPEHTPEVLAEIQLGGEGRQIAGATGAVPTRIDLYQRLAVGKAAVASDAARLLFQSSATAAPLVSSDPASLALAADLRNQLTDPQTRDRAKTWINTQFPDNPNRNNPGAFLDSPPGGTPTLARLRDALTSAPEARP